MNEVASYAKNEPNILNNVVEEYLPLVKKIGLHLVGRLPPQVELDDLLQIGVIGLMRAQESYDASQGASFATYASIRIKGAMLDEVRRNGWAPRSIQQKMKLVSGAIKQVESKLIGPATDGDIAKELGMSLDEYHTLSRELIGSRMGELEDPDETQGDARQDPFSQLQDSGTKEAIAQAIKALPEKEQLMMSLYYGDELNLKEIGEVLGVSESRVSQIHGQALARIRTKLSTWLDSGAVS